MKHRKLIASGLVMALALGMCIPLLGGGAALAATSLPHIEEIKSSLSLTGDSFVILEVVPADHEGSIGYYVNGQDPYADWETELSLLTSPEARRGFMSDLFNRLANAGVISDTAATPMTRTQVYAEAYPWDAHDGMRQLTLAQAETASVAASFTAASGGAYSSTYEYELVEGVGGYIQDIESLVYDGEADYYYDPVFKELNELPDPDDPEDTVELPDVTDGTGIYKTATTDTGIEYYDYVGSFGSPGVKLDIMQQYYVIESTGRPSAVKTGDYMYAANSYDFIAAANGYFERNLTGYVYVGSGGDCDLTSLTGEPVEVTTSVVYISGGYTGNDWFLRNVFDMTTDFSSVRVTVNSITAADVTTDMVDAADMIVLSAGFAEDKSGLYSSTDDTSTYNDLSDSAAFRIYNAAAGGRALVVDYRIPASTSDNTNMVELSRLLLSGELAQRNEDGEFRDVYDSITWAEPSDGDKNFVSGSVLCFSGTSPALASSQLAAELPELGFESVIAEITNENFLRENEGMDSDQLLRVYASLATAMRYIINYGGQRESTAKTSLRVLEIQPGTGSQLTRAQVLTWAGADSGLAENNISITTMSTAEFIGKIEDLNETYDLVYVGDSATGFNTAADGSTVYNDTTMNGLLYSNIGDEFHANLALAGLLDTDYTTVGEREGINYASGSTANLFRFSGNDLTGTKQDELKAFVMAGYPVVIADGLFDSSETNSSSFTFSVTLTGEAIGSTVNLNANITGIPTGVDYTVRWYRLRNGSSFPIANEGTTYSFTADSITSYYCTVTVGEETARSNTLRVNYSPGSGKTVSISATGSTVSNISYKYYTNYYGQRTVTGTISVRIDRTSASWEQRLYVARIDFEPDPYGNAADRLTYTYRWYREGSTEPVGYGDVLNYGSLGDGVYYCEVSISRKNYIWDLYVETNPLRTNSATITTGESNATFTNRGGGYSATVTTTTAVSDSTDPINLDTVDKNSYVYSTLDSIRAYSNVMSAYEAGSNAGALSGYLNLSKPEIVWTDGALSYPVEYALSGNSATAMTAVSGVYYLNYDFHIENETDATPHLTTYNVKLYLDLNSDGKYSASESVSDIVVRDSSGRLLSTADGVYALTADARYTVTRQMPTGYTGIIPWKLEVVKNNAEHIHTSQHNYSRIAPDEDQVTTIEILQICSDNTTKINLQKQLETQAGNGNPQLLGNDGEYYTGIYGKLIADVEDFDIKITSETIEEIGDRGSQDDIYAYLDTFNMLIIGFDDMYGTLSDNAAKAIVAYIKSGKAVLFTHDTTSLSNLEAGASTPVFTSSSSVQSYTTNWTNTGKWSDGYGTKPGVSYSNYSRALSFSWNYYGGGAYLRFNNANNSSFTLSPGNYTLTVTVANTGNYPVQVGIGRNNDNAITQVAVAAMSTETVTLDFTTPDNSGRSIFLYADYGGSSATISDLRLTSSNSSTIGSYNGPSFWGYSFNSILRDAVGLDRYGVTSSAVSGIVASGSAATIGASAANLLSAGYSVPYEPTTSIASSRTQGYTNYSLIRYAASNSEYEYAANDYTDRETTYISQVNEGQITSYPYNINTQGFGNYDTTGIGGSSYMQIGLTHEQYYQLNMNSDDIVVWYCLSGGGDTDSYYNDRPNDVMNAYYIYSLGNVTYSGVGHTAEQSHYTATSIAERYVNEAKLFVNTMIAAYRTVSEPPTVRFVEDAAGETEAEFFFLTSDGGIIEQGFSATNEELAVYFRLSDPNISKEKDMALSFYYTKEDMSEWDGADPVQNFDPTIYLAETGTPVSDADLYGGVVYKFYLNQAILNVLQSENVTTVKLFMNLHTVVDGTSFDDGDLIELRKIGLVPLK